VLSRNKVGLTEVGPGFKKKKENPFSLKGRALVFEIKSTGSIPVRDIGGIYFQ
jgi:hypothetical protein